MIFVKCRHMLCHVRRELGGWGFASQSLRHGPDEVGPVTTAQSHILDTQSLQLVGEISNVLTRTQPHVQVDRKT